MKNNLLRIDEYRNNPEFYFSKGLRCANKKNLKDAYKNLAKAASLEPDNSEYKFNIACFLSEMHRPREANRLFNDILINYDPTLYDCYFGLGCNWLEIGNIEKAAENFEKYLYFDEEGEFNEEVREMTLYLKLYNNISIDKKFLRLSRSNFKKAIKNIGENHIKTATKDLYRAISLNPFNVTARNLLTLLYLEQGRPEKAFYMNDTVIAAFPGDIWASCLKIFILSYDKKPKKLKQALDYIVYDDINNRDELLCVATTLFVFGRITDFIKIFEMYITAYSDWFIYAALLLGYTVAGNLEKMKVIEAELRAMKYDDKLYDWIKSIGKNDPLQAYQTLFAMDKQRSAYYMYHPEKYGRLVGIKRVRPRRLTSKSLSVIKCALEHREIMYTPSYEKEIINIFNNIVSLNDELLNKLDDRVESYSAVLEYIYCLENCIEMDKEELKQKYNVPSLIFNQVLKKFDYRP